MTDEAKQKERWTEQSRKDLAGVRESEERVGRLAERASNMVAEDGSAVVFAALLMEVQDRLSDVVSLLEKEETGPPTRDTQREIEKTIAELLAALEDDREPPPPSDPQDSDPKEQRPPPPPPLIALAQELRLLKAQQLRVNERTTAIQNDIQNESRPESKAELPHLSDRQRKIHDMTQDLMKKLSGESEDPWEAI